MKFKLSITIIIFVIPLLLYADRVTIKNGTEFDGAILKADDRLVYIQVSDTLFSRIPHSLINAITFRYADMVYLLNGEKIKGKVLSKTVSDLNIVAESGPQTIKISDLKRYFYNERDSLNITSLPPTGDIFNNEKSLALMDTKMDKTIFFSLSGGAIYPDGEAWQESFVTANSLLGMYGQGQVGFTLVKNIAVYSGYMSCQYDNTAENDLQSNVNFGYYHVGMDYLRSFDFLPGVDFSLGGDVGMVKLSGNIYTYSYRNLELSGISPNIAFRLLMGTRLFFMNQLAGYLKVGYLKVQDFTIPVPADIEYNVKLPLSGWTIMAGASFYIPI